MTMNNQSTMWTLSGFQTFALLSSSYLPLTTLFFPRTAVEYAGYDAQWSIIGLGIAFFVSAWLHAGLNQRLSGVSGPDMLTLVYGLWMGRILQGLFFAVYILFLSESLLFFAQTVQQDFLRTTPRLVVLLSIAFVAWYGSHQGVEALGRVAAIIWPLTVFGLVFVLSTALVTGQFGLHLPNHVTSWSRTTKGMYELMPIGLGFSSILLLNPYYKKNKRTKWIPFLSVGTAILVIVLAMLATIDNLGWQAPRHLMFVLPAIFRLARYTGFIVENYGVFILVLFTGFEVLFISVVVWSLAVLMARMFGQPEAKFPIYGAPILLLVIGVTLFIPSDVMANLLITKILVPVSWFILLIEPGIKLALSYLFRKSS